MKKLFTYLLISSMVVLSSCTNYDDQFDDLNSQLNTLKSQIDGLAAVSSGVTALQGTVSSLQTAVAALPKTATPATDVSGIVTNQTALTAALAALAVEVAAIKTALSGAATAAEVAALAASLVTAQTDLTKILSQNNIYSTPVSITTVAELDLAVTLGDKLTIVNSSVTVTHISTMDATKLAGVLAKMTSITGNLIYTAKGTSVVPTAGFTSLSGVSDLTVDTDGDISFPVLATAADVWLKNNVKTTSISFPALVSVTSLGGAAASDDVLSHTAATSFDMGLLTRYSEVSLSITTKSGLTNLDALQIYAANGITKEITALTLNGATEVSLDALIEGQITANSVLTVDFPIWKGNTSSIFAKATTVVLPKIEANATANSYAVKDMFPLATSVHIIGAAKALSTTTTGTPSVSVVSQTNIKTLILDGTLDEVTVTGTTALNSVTHTGTAKDVTYTGTAVVNMVLAYTSAKAGSTNATAVNGGLNISTNTSLESVVANSVDDITSLTLKTNAKLASVSFTALNSVGTATNAVVEISGNDLTIEKIQLASASTVLPVVAKSINSVDLGPLKTYIVAAKAAVGTTGSIKVVADTVTSKLNADGTAATVLPADKIISNFEVAANRKSNAVGGVAGSREFHFSSDGTYTFSVNGFNSSVSGDSDISYDLAAWAANSSNVAGFDAAGVTVSTGAGAHTGTATLTALDATSVGAMTYSIAVNGTTYSTSVAATTTIAAVVAALALDIVAGKDVSIAKHFTVASNTSALTFVSSSKGSASVPFNIGSFVSNLGTSTSGVITNTNASTTVVAMARPTTSAYVKVTANSGGIVFDNTRIATFTGGAPSATTLASDGTTTAITTTGDNENVVTATDGTVQTNAAAITTASVYEVAYLAS
jgi:hypothetical protein